MIFFLLLFFLHLVFHTNPLKIKDQPFNLLILQIWSIFFLLYIYFLSWIIYKMVFLFNFIPLNFFYLLNLILIFLIAIFCLKLFFKFILFYNFTLSFFLSNLTLMFFYCWFFCFDGFFKLINNKFLDWTRIHNFTSCEFLRFDKVYDIFPGFFKDFFSFF